MSPGASGFYRRVFALVAVGAIAVVFLRILEPFVGAILWASLLAFMLDPLNRALVGALRGRRAAAAGLLTFAVTLMIVGPVTAAVVAFARQTTDLVAWAQTAMPAFRTVRLSDVLQIPLIAGVMRRLGSIAPISPEQIQHWFLEAGRRLLQALVETSGSLVAEAVGVVVSVTLTVFLLFFFLRDGEEVLGRLVRLIPLETKRKADLLDHLGAVTRAVVLGALFTALVQGTLVGVAFAIASLPSPVVFGFLAMIAALVPLVGSALVWVPAAVTLAVQGRWGAAAFLVVWGAVVVSGIDNFVRPLVISGRAQISTLPVFLGLLGGLTAFGPIGIVLGPVVVALVLALMRFAEEAYGSEPQAGGHVDTRSDARA